MTPRRNKQLKFRGMLPVFQPAYIDNPYAAQVYTRCPTCRAPIMSCDEGLYCGRCGWDNFEDLPEEKKDG